MSHGPTTLLTRPPRFEQAATALAAVVPVAIVVAAQLLVFPMPVGVWVQGVVLGLLGALMAVGLGLVYRLNRVVNFAQGDLGSAPAVLAFGLVGLSGVNYFLGLAHRAGGGGRPRRAAVEILVIRRFARSPRLMLTVATIGLSQTLIVLSLLIPNIWGQTPDRHRHRALPLAPVDSACRPSSSPPTTWWRSSWPRGGSWPGGAVVPVHRPRASPPGPRGDRRDRAAMLGIPVNRLQTVTWVVAGVLSFFSVFLKAAIVGLPLDPIFSLTALVGALGALALGGFTDLPVVAVAAVAIGTLEQGVAWDQPAQPTLVLAVIAAVVLARHVLPAG